MTSVITLADYDPGEVGPIDDYDELVKHFVEGVDYPSGSTDAVRRRAIQDGLVQGYGLDEAEVQGRWASGTQGALNWLLFYDPEVAPCCYLLWAIMFEAGSDSLTDEYRRWVACAISNRTEWLVYRRVDRNRERIPDDQGQPRAGEMAAVVLAGLQFSFLNRTEATSADALKVFYLLSHRDCEPARDDFGELFPWGRPGESPKARDMRRRWENAVSALGEDCSQQLEDCEGVDHYYVDVGGLSPDWAEGRTPAHSIRHGRHTTRFYRLGGETRIPLGFAY
jgi:hypothetical protein